MVFYKISANDEDDLKYLTLIHTLLFRWKIITTTKHVIYAYGDSMSSTFNTDHDEHYMGYGLMGYVRDYLLL